MQLQGRNLEEGLTGADVSLLHFELKLVGHPPPEDEVLNNTFGPGTQQAMQAFQSKQGLKATGIVDAATAKAINTIAAQVPIDIVLARLGEEIARYQAQIDQLRQGNPDLAQEVERLRTALQAMQTECERVKGEAAASAAQVAALEQALATAQARIVELEALLEQPNGGQTDGFVVHGQVRNSEGEAVSGLIVRAYDQDLPSLQRDTPLGQFLGETATDGDGAYRIAYSAEKFSRAEKMNADLVVRAFTIFGAVIAESALWFNAPSVGQVDLVIASDNAGLSEYERYLAAIAPLIETVAVADLTAADLGFLAGETGVAKPYLELLVLAHQHAAPPEFEMEAAVFYGLMRGGLPTELNALLAQPPQMQRDALKRAIDENIIPTRFGNNIDVLVEQLQNLRIETMLQPPGGQEPSNLSVMLSTALPDIDQQQAFLSLYTQHPGDIEKFWADLPKQPGFEDAGVVKRIQYTLQLNLLAGGNVPLVQALASDNNLHSTLDLVALDAAAWQARIAATGPQGIAQIPAHIRGTNDEEKIANYAGSIVETLRAAFPSQYLKNAIAVEPAIDLELVKQVQVLNPAWDLDPRQPLPDDMKWDGIGDGDRQKALDALEALRAELNTYPGLKVETVLNGEQGFHNPIRAGVQTFLDQAEDFDFGKTNIDVYLAQMGDAAFMDQRNPVTQQIKAFQRIYQVVPRHDSVMALMSAGLHSALAISDVPEDVFVESLGGKVGGALQARLIHENARELRDRATLALGNAIQMTSEVFPRALKAPDTTPESTTLALAARGDGVSAADDVRGLYATLFGQLNLCGCEHCRSVYSPAAYFVDLLHFLNREDMHSSTWRPGPLYSLPRPRPLDVLLRRRPDLQHIALTCENTHTLVPYIDLVNEILESYIAHSNLNRSLGNAGSATSAELLATPQNVNIAAYDRLKAALYPMTLPFDRDLEIVRTYLAHLGTSRYAVMRTFQRVRPLTSDAQTDLAIEYLKIGPSERDILTGAIFAAPSPTTLAELYGYQATEDGLPPVELETVATFLERTHLSYEQLTEILRTRFINPNGADHKNSIIIVFTDNRCDTNSCYLRLKKDRERTGELRSLQAEAWNRFHHFIRLWRKLEWSIADVDRALVALGVTTPDDFDLRFLRRLGQVVQLRDELNLSLPQTLSLWAEIDTYGNDERTPHIGSLYSDLFLSRTVSDLAAHPQAFALPIPDAVPAGARTISHPQNRLAIQAALRITAADLDAIQARAGVTDELTLANLSALHRYAVLARALQMRVRDMLDLETLSGIDPFAPASPTPGNANPTQQEGTARFVALACKVQRSGFSMTLLNYLYRHREDPPHRLGLRAEESEAHLTTLRDGLRNLLREFDATESEQERLRKVLSTVVADPVAVERILTLPNGIVPFSVPLTERPPVVFPAPFSAQISYDEVQKQLRFRGAMTEAERTTLQGLAGSTEPYRDAIMRLFDLPRQMIARPLGAFLAADAVLARLVNNSAATWSSRYQYILPRALDFLSRSFVIQSLADALRLDVDMMQTLLTGALRSPADATKPILVDFLALSTPMPPPSSDVPEPLPIAARQALELLHKADLLITTARLTAAELAHLAAHGGDFDGFDLNALPLREAAPPASFASWEHLHDPVTFRASLPRGDELVKVFGAADFAAAKEALLAATGWDRAALDSALGDQGLQLSATNFRNHFKNEARLLDLAASITFSRQLGVSPATGFAWAANTPDATQAREVQSAVKAKYDEKAWLTVAKALNDPLREQQREALVAYTLTLPTLPRDIRTPMDLFEYFLIDVDMSACQPTSRIKQAISSMQLFVQRCLMNLEPSVSPKLLPADQWQWMRKYRVWEANRKVFLYPENWIEPELRDDKSPIFKEFENELLQNDLTAETVENAFMNYLDRLDEIARLDVRGMYWEYESELTWDEPLPDSPERADILHVFARTQGTPPVYYYRRLINHKQWTPWEKVQADIEGDHLIPVVFNRRLYLFWPLFRETTDMNQPPPQEGQPARQPEKRLQIQLAWSEYKDGKWSAKKVTQAAIATEYLPVEDRSLFHFDVQKESEGLVIWCRWEDPLWAIQERFTRTALAGRLQELGRPVLRRRPPRTSEEVRELLWRLGRPDAVPLPFTVYPNYYTSGRFVFNGCDNQTRTVSENRRMPALDAPLPLSNGFIDGQMSQSVAGALVLRCADETQQWTLGLPDAPIPIPFRLLHSHQSFQYLLQAPFFYQDRQRTYFVTPEQTAGILEQLTSDTFVTLNYSTSLVQAISGLGERRVNLQPPSANLNTLWRATWDNWGYCVGDQIIEEGASSRWATSLKLRFHTFFHPYVCDFIKRLKRKGIPGMLIVDVQKQSDFTRNDTALGDNEYTQFKTRYNPQQFVDLDYPKEDIDFDGGAYALYNWELFFHAPLLIADRLSQNQRFEEARQWFHYILDPTTSSTEPNPQRYWNMLPFYRNYLAPRDQINEQMYLLSYRGSDAEILRRKEDLEAQITAWRNDPFNPHHIARLRITAYQKAVLMKYIDNLLAWGDQLFRQDTIESINEATQLYILAYQLLGPRPEIVPPPSQPPVQTFAQLRPELDRFANALVSSENGIAGRRCMPLTPSRGSRNGGSLSLGATLYFCIPPNDKLLSYWDTVEDRLFKIRHCMNIEGVVRQLPLFEPPIDPALLVRARAAGLDLSRVLNDINAGLPHYRFQVMLQKALELAGEVRALGNALLSALEKRDAEALSLLRSTHEIKLLEAVRDVRQKQVDEAAESIAGLQRSREVVEARQHYYQGLMRVLAGSQAPTDIITVSTPLNEQERQSLIYFKAARDFQGVAGSAEILASIISIFPTISFPGGGAGTGGLNLGNAAQAIGRFFSLVGAEHTYLATHAATMGSYVRRAQEWEFQAGQAGKELAQIDRQVAAAQIRHDIAVRELQNHELQMDNARAVDEFMRTKFTNRELYDWMVAQTSALYFQAYQLAYDMAKRAERAYQFERGITSSNFIQFGYWDSLRKGLLAGERLTLDLKRLDAAYLDQNRREYEITKHISLVLHDPLALIALKTTGACTVRLPEALFDADYPGHFMRRVKSASLTIPAVVGPYTSINCTLTLQSHKIRKDTSRAADAASYREQEDDNRFLYHFGPLQSIATSHGQNDTGMFELNFRDERYLPFEGAGAISEWRIEMPRETNAFDFDTIADVVIRLNYTARDGSDPLRNAARSALGLPTAVVPGPAEPSALRRMFSLKHEYTTEWFQFIQTSGAQEMHFDLSLDRFPFQFRSSTITVQHFDVFLVRKAGATALPTAITVKKPDRTPVQFRAPDGSTTSNWPLAPLYNLPHSRISVGAPRSAGTNATWTLGLPEGVRISVEQVEDIIVVCTFSA